MEQEKQRNKPPQTLRDSNSCVKCMHYKAIEYLCKMHNYVLGSDADYVLCDDYCIRLFPINER
jgi:hypothetical protein